MTRTAEPAPAFAVKVRPKFREVVLPPGPPPLIRGRVPGAAGRPEAVPPGRDGPDRPA